MANTFTPKIPTNAPPEQTLTQTTFQNGVITLVNESKLKGTALKELTNGFLYEDGAAGPRWGVDWFGTAPLLVAPTAPTLALTTGANLGIGVYIYSVSFVNSQGETLAGTTATITTTTGNQAVNLSAIPLGPGGVVSRKIYRTAVGGAAGTAKLLTTIGDNTTTTYADTKADASLGAALPTTNTSTAAIDGAAMYQSAAGAIHMVVVAGGNIFRSTDNCTTWTICTGATFNPGQKAYFEQGSTSSGGGNNYLFITDGYDYPVRYDGTTTLQTYTAINPPTAPTISQTGLTGTNYTFYYRVVAVNNVGITQGTASVSITVANLRDAWDPANVGGKFVTFSWTAAAGAVRYDVYMADNASDDAANNHLYLASVGQTTYTDTGHDIPNPNSQVPIQNTTGAPRVGEFTFINGRLWGTRDRDYPYRVWFSGSGPFLGYFSDSYDGGYIDLQRGSQFFPVKAVDYRDGKATPLTTVFAKSADGRGCVWQIALNSATILSTTYTQPSANKLPGSRGTAAPNSVVGVLNDFMFFNYQAWYNVGSRAQFLNLLSTDESSANIRPTLTQNINPAYADNISAYFYLAKVFCSMPFNSTTNNVTAIYDTERKAWIPNAYSIGMERLFQYVDTNRQNHLLFWKPGDSRLSETSAAFTSDYGVAFQTSLTTGLIPTQKDRFQFMYIDEAEVEFALPVGPINVELVGIERNRGYATQRTVTVTPKVSATNVGWGAGQGWSTTPWGDTSTAAVNYAEPSEKRWFIVNKEMNAYQWHITSNSTNSSWLVRTLQMQGTPTQAGLPPQWRLQAH